MRLLFFAIIAVSLLCVIIPSVVLEVFADDRDRPCRVSGSYSTYPVTYTGLKRENPKDTYYPGDAFHYILKYKGGSKCAKSPYVTATETHGGDYSLSRGHYLEDESSKKAFEKIVERRCSDLPSYTYCRIGHGDISTSAPSQRGLFEKYGERNPLLRSANVTIVVESDSKFCNKETGCKWRHHVKPLTLIVDVRNPQIHITFERPTMIDFEGFDSKNIDETYYVWDYPALLIEPNLLWREQRAGIISFEVTRTSTPISEVFSRGFDGSRGITIATGQGTHSEPITPTGVSVINGDHVEVLYPQSLNDLGLQTFPYDVNVYNIKGDGGSRKISSGSASIDTLIADYTPIYSDFHFPYILLNTEGDTTYEKQPGVALHYLGSKGTGPNDDNKIHGDRRSKINDSAHEIHANTLTTTYDIKSEMKLKGGDGIKTIADSVHLTILESLERENLGDDYVDPLLSIGDTTVFFQEGHGRIPFTFDGLGEEMKDIGVAELNIDNTLHSKNYGGYDDTTLYDYSYQHPVAFVASSINVTAITSEGTVDESIDIKVLFEANHDTGKTLHLSEYMESHIDNFEKKSKKIHASKNNRFSNPQAVTLPLEFADMYLGDMYGVVNNGTGTGMLIVPINLPAVKVLSEVSTAFGYDPEISKEDLSDITSDVTSRPPSPDESSDTDDVPNTTPVGRDNTRNIDRTTTDGGGEVSSASSDGPICIPDCVFVDIDDEIAFTQFGEEYSYSSPVSYNMTVFANGLDHIIPFTTYGFSGAINYTLNADSGNYLNSTVYKGAEAPTVHIRSEDSFGPIDKITINGELYDGTCVTSCQLIVPGDAVIEATNIWGGTASVNIKAEEEWTGPNKQRDIVIAYVDATTPMIIVLAVVFTAVVTYIRFLRGGR